MQIGPLILVLRNISENCNFFMIRRKLLFEKRKSMILKIDNSGYTPFLCKDKKYETVRNEWTGQTSQNILIKDMT